MQNVQPGNAVQDFLKLMQAGYRPGAGLFVRAHAAERHSVLYSRTFQSSCNCIARPALVAAKILAGHAGRDHGIDALRACECFGESGLIAHVGHKSLGPTRHE
jgi:hypothetical protein